MVALLGLRAARPGTSMPVPHWPFRSVRANASACPDGLTYCPPAAQSPSGAHDTDFTAASLARLACAAELAVASSTAEFAVADMTTDARIGAVIAAATMRLL